MTIDFDRRLHDAGEATPVAGRSIAQALAWWVGADLVRRHPNRLRLIETHPGGGQYDCLTVLDLDSAAASDALLHMNMQPGGHLTPRSWGHSSDTASGERFNWLEVLLCRDRRTYVVSQIERLEGLRSPESTPATTAASIGPRLIAGILQHFMLGPARWRADNAILDSSDGGGPRENLLDQFPGVADAVWDSLGSEPFGETRYRLWFLSKEHRDPARTPSARFAIDTWAGVLWDRDGNRTDLLAEYDELGRSLTALIGELFLGKDQP